MENSQTQNSPSEAFRNVPKDSETFGSVPNHTEAFRTIPKASERKENHSLTVREAARVFEAAGVARTERSIINWCQLNAQGVARLDAYFDPNERKYFITPQSVQLAIAEEKAKVGKNNVPTESRPAVANDAPQKADEFANGRESARLKELEFQIRDLDIANRVKDGVIEMKDRQIQQLQADQRDYIERLITSGRRIGELETKLLQLEDGSARNPETPTRLPVTSVP